MAPQLEQLNKQVSRLSVELKLLRSFVIGMAGKDKEGNYNPRFVERVLKSAGEENVGFFENKESFLKQIRTSY